MRLCQPREKSHKLTLLGCNLHMRSRQWECLFTHSPEHVGLAQADLSYVAVDSLIETEGSGGHGSSQQAAQRKTMARNPATLIALELSSQVGFVYAGHI